MTCMCVSRVIKYMCVSCIECVLVVSRVIKYV